VGLAEVINSEDSLAKTSDGRLLTDSGLPFLPERQRDSDDPKVADCTVRDF